MAILFVTWNFPPRRGGIENLMAQLFTGLKKSHTVFVITAHATNGRERDVFRAPWPGLIPFAFYALWRGAALLMRNPNIDVVFGGSAMVTPLVYFLARTFRRKAVVQAHGLDLVYSSFIYQALCVRWLSCCDAVLANSNFTGSLATERGVSRNAISVIPLGVDGVRFAPTPTPIELKQEFSFQSRQIILFVGRLARRKGVREFVENCLPIIVQELPQAVFVVAGGNPSESLTHRDDVQTEIEAAVRERGLQEHVRLLGEVSDDELVKLYRCCDIVVLPALASTKDVEGFGMVLLEAAAAGKAVVATRVGGISDAVDDGITGILVEAGDYITLAKSIIGYLSDDERRLKAGENGRQFVHSRFSWESVTARYEKVFLSL